MNAELVQHQMENGDMTFRVLLENGVYLDKGVIQVWMVPLHSRRVAFIDLYVVHRLLC